MGNLLLVGAVETGSLNSVAITSEMLKPVLDGVVANIGVILPVGIAIFAVMIGVNLVPKLIKKFSHA